MSAALTLTMPDDWHVHLRDGAILKAVLPQTVRRFARALVMPNLKPPITTVEAASAYRTRILEALPPAADFAPLMTLYLTETTSAEEIRRAKASGFIHAAKLYPAGATTHSDAGVRDWTKIFPLLAAMEKEGLPLSIHGEVTTPSVDIFDREAVFLESVLDPLLRRFPALKVVLEHITTEEAARFVAQAGENVAATITAHHLLENRNALFREGLRPHWYCLPVLKCEWHRQALARAATSGSGKFFLGTDSAPHTRAAKEASCGCAGCYTACAALELYAEAFAAEDALSRLEGFASFHGADFYGLPRNRQSVTLIQEDWRLPEHRVLDDGQSLIPFRAGEILRWRLAETASTHG